MIKCPQCSHENIDGTLFCDECGCDLAGVEPEAAGVASPPPAAPAAVSPTPDPMAGAPAPQPASPAPVSAPVSASATGQPRLVVVRGVTPNEEFKLWEGPNVIGRTDDRPVDIDLEQQETPDRQWVSRQHARLELSGGVCTVEDIGSGNGTFVNRGSRLQVGQPVELHDGDVIQVGTVHLKYTI
jgi:pSer/pThr/pTyr-binding forkhead associated (FHA) protein